MSHEKTSVVIRNIKRAAKVRGMEFTISRPGGNHTIWDLDGHMVTISNGTRVTRVECVYQQLQGKLGKGWWRNG